MNLSQKLRKKLVLSVDPHAYDEGTLLGDLEKHEARLAADPNIQAFNAGLWGAAAWFAPGLMEPGVEVAGFIVSSAILWRMNRA
jgi:hypothetical protein